MRHRLTTTAVALILGLSLTTPAVPAEWSGMPMSMSVRDAETHEVLSAIAKVAGKRLAIEKGLDLSGPTTAVLREVPWDQALDQIARVNELQAQITSEFIVVGAGTDQLGLIR